MKVWVITVGEPLPGHSGDARPWRTGMLSEELARRGHEVTWWTSSMDHFTKRQFVDGSRRELLPGGRTLQFLHGRSYKKNISIGRLVNHREIALEFGRIAASTIAPDVVWCSLPTIELSDAATLYGSSRGVPVVVDIRDLWPDEMYRRSPSWLRPVARTVLAPMERTVRSALQRASGITAISNQYLEWGLQRAGRERTATDGLFPMGYPTADGRSKVVPAAAERALQAGVDPSRRIIWFAGNFVSSADLKPAIDAARMLPDVQFVLTGAGEMEGAWRSLAQGLENVVFTGWANKDELAWLASVAWAALVAYGPGALQSLPNKLFEYMSFGLPVLTSLEGEARALVEQRDFGSYYRPGRSEDLIKAIQRIVADPERRNRQSRNARELLEREYSAAAVYGGLADFLERQATTVQELACR